MGFLKDTPTDTVPMRRLPEPAKMTMSVTDALMRRHSSRDFSDEPISDAELAAVLWAADGINRSDGKRTTPCALNWQEVDVYVVKASAVWLWQPKDNALKLVNEWDHRADTCLFQPGIKKAPVHLVYVSNADRTQHFFADMALKLLKGAGKKDMVEMTEEAKERSYVLDIGVKLQSVYVACAALGLNCLARQTFDPDKVSKALHLKENHRPICIQTVGYKPDSILGL